MTIRHTATVDRPLTMGTHGTCFHPQDEQPLTLGTHGTCLHPQDEEPIAQALTTIDAAELGRLAGAAAE
jgi:hypothetical protein